MEIIEYSEAKDIPERFIPSLVRSEIECWWSEPFSEYKMCEQCHAIFSIEEIHGSLKNFREWNNSWDSFSCLECSWETKYIYKTDAFLDLVKNYIKWDVSAILLMTPEQNVEWFGILSKTTVEGIVNNEFATRPWSYDKEELSMILLKELRKFDKELICLHQIYISPDFREGDLSFNLLRDLFFLKKEYMNIPVIWEARYDNRFYPISRALWFRNVMDDDHWYVIQLINKYWSILELLEWISWFWDKNIASNLFKFKRESVRILKQKTHLFKRKFYN